MSAFRLIKAPLSPNSLPQAGERGKVSLREFLIEQPAVRIALAAALSLLIHAALLFGPNLIELQPVEALLPPLTARLEPLPAVKPAPKPKPHVPTKRKTVLPPAPMAAVTTSLPDTSPAPQEVAPPVEEVQAPQAAVTEEAQPAHPLPKHAQLNFTIYKGTDFPVGQARHRLKINDDNSYILQVGINTTGLASLFKTFAMDQQSSGTTSAAGLQPDEFSEGRISDKGEQTLSARFDWQNKQLDFSNGNHAVLPEHAQDVLSFLYQLSQLPLDQATVSMYISNGKKLDKYELAVGEEEYILTRTGKMRALPLRRVRQPGEEGLEIWLGLEYRLLPVQIRSINRNGEIAGQMTISEIRVSEE
ncbi:MAG: DUF3108 domain-containing protein [Gallionella sp.]|nr:DUF3108 domain-containing protein [Gallionella sp.]